MNVIIRKARDEDYSKVYYLNLEFANLYNAKDMFTLSREQFIHDKDLYCCKVAEIEDGNIIGFTTSFVAYYSWIGKVLYLDDLFVTSDMRNHGIGEKLLDDAILIAKDSKCKRLVWKVSAWNQRARKFYQSKKTNFIEGEINCYIEI